MITELQKTCSQYIVMQIVISRPWDFSDAVFSITAHATHIKVHSSKCAKSALAWSITSLVPNFLIKAHFQSQFAESATTILPQYTPTPSFSHLPSYLIEVLLALRCDASTPAAISIHVIHTSHETPIQGALWPPLTHCHCPVRWVSSSQAVAWCACGRTMMPSRSGRDTYHDAGDLK